MENGNVALKIDNPEQFWKGIVKDGSDWMSPEEKRNLTEFENPIRLKLGLPEGSALEGDMDISHMGTSNGVLPTFELVERRD